MAKMLSFALNYFNGLNTICADNFTVFMDNQLASSENLQLIMLI